MIEEIWRKPKVLAATGMKATSLYEAVRRGDFPAPVKIGARAVGWRSSEVEEWIATRERADQRVSRRRPT